eukprot:g4095.t1
MLSTIKGAYRGFASFGSITHPDRHTLNHRTKDRRTLPGNFHTQPFTSQSLGTSSLRRKTKRLIVAQSTVSGEVCCSSVKFSVPVRVDFGDTVKVVGNHPLLGSWNTDEGLELEWSDGHIWEKETNITPGEYEFKCVIVCARGFPRWEPGPNRVLKVEEGQLGLDVGCKWWNTSMSNIKTVTPSLSFTQGVSSSSSASVNPLPPTTNIPQPPPPPPNESGTLQLTAAGHTIPHIEKVEKKGEDAFFISTIRNGVIGLADGVGSWSKEGIDPAVYANGLMREAKRAVEFKKRKYSARESMMVAQNKNAVIGSSTCVLAILEHNILDIANVGDSELRLLRNGKIIFSTKPQEHEFNYPYQLTCLDYLEGDKALDADGYKVHVEEGDVIIMGSDGIFDNIWDEGLEEIVEATLVRLPDRSECSAMAMANAISLAAHRNALNPEFYSPWTDGATRAAGQTTMVDRLVFENTHNPYMGGKMDDCTTIVAFVSAV